MNVEWILIFLFYKMFETKNNLLESHTANTEQATQTNPF